MGLFDRLFGWKSQVPGRPQWLTSESGNKTIVRGNFRATVFQQDGGWKVVVSDELDRVDSVFGKKRYATQEEAMDAAWADLSSAP